MLPDGLEFYTANGNAFRFPVWMFDRVLLPFFVGWGYYRGLRTKFGESTPIKH